MTTALLIVFSSCKKNYINQGQLVGLWTEIKPCVRDSNHCYTLQFTSNNKIYVSTPFIDTANYSLNNNNIQIDESVNCGPGTMGSGIYQVSISDSDLSIIKFYVPCILFGGTPPPVNLHLKKN